MMQYRRVVDFFAAHFNETAYDKWLSVQRGDRSVATIQDLLSDIHGHNFRAIVTLTHDTALGYSSYIVSDESLLAIVSEWGGLNLSVHPDFQNIRATTENMAAVLASKVARVCPPHSTTVVVEIQESRDISATFTLRTENHDHRNPPTPRYASYQTLVRRRPEGHAAG